MTLLTFDEAFKPTAEDIARGDGYTKRESNAPKEYPEFGKIAVLSPVTNLRDFLKSQSYMFTMKYYEENKPGDQISGDHFKYVRVLGSGAFGTVTMVRCVHNGIYYARKTMSKHLLVRSDLIETAKNEKKILDSLRYPFTVHLKYFYKDFNNIHFILPILAGGELFDFLKVIKKLRERLTKFISAQLLLALEYLHCVGIIHRDIKLENILIDHYGYVKISDFGLCKIVKQNRTYTMCGTAEYMAPEVINRNGYGLAADWWSFGVLIYEMCNGLSPFYAEEVIQTFNLITQCKYNMPKHFSIDLRRLIENLLQIDLTKRIGNLKNGVNDIKNQSWFRNVPWLAIVNRRIISPMIPFVSDEHNKSFFEPTPEPTMATSKVDLYAEEFANF